MNVLFSICSPWKVGIDTFGIPSPGSWVDRVVVVHFNLDYSYPNMKNSDNESVFYGRKSYECFLRPTGKGKYPIDQRLQHRLGSRTFFVLTSLLKP